MVQRWIGNLLIFGLLSKVIGLCDNGWTNYENYCYYVYSRTETWTSAINTCSSDNAWLTMVTSYNEQEFVKSLIQSQIGGYQNAWIGASDTSNEGTWRWSSTNAKVVYTAWGPREPNGGTRENCLGMWKNHGMGWDDFKCTGRRIFVCQKEILATTTTAITTTAESTTPPQTTEATSTELYTTATSSFLTSPQTTNEMTTTSTTYSTATSLAESMSSNKENTTGSMELICVWKNKSKTLTSEELEQSLVKLRNDLLIMRNTTSTARRKLTSASDERPSAKAIGYTGVVILCLLQCVIIIIDIPNGRYKKKNSNKKLKEDATESNSFMNEVCQKYL